MHVNCNKLWMNLNSFCIAVYLLWFVPFSKMAKPLLMHVTINLYFSRLSVPKRKCCAPEPSAESGLETVKFISINGALKSGQSQMSVEMLHESVTAQCVSLRSECRTWTMMCIHTEQKYKCKTCIFLLSFFLSWNNSLFYVDKRPVTLKHCSQICHSEHICFAKTLHLPRRCGISKWWLGSMIIAQILSAPQAHPIQ